MKLRQKLAVVLASAMIVSAIPVTTMAATTNKLSKTISMVEGTKVTTDTKLFLEMKFDSAKTSTTTFFVKADEFKFDVNEYAQFNQAKAALEAAIKATATANQTISGIKFVNDADGTALKEVRYDLTVKTTAADGTVTTTTTVKTVAAASLGLTTELTAYNTTLAAADAGQFTYGAATVNVLSDKELKVTVTGIVAGTTEIAVPILGEAKKGNPSITVDGLDSEATTGKYSLTSGEVVTDKVLAATAGDVKNISVDGFGTIADITIAEQEADKLGNKTVTISLPNSSDLIFHADYANTTAIKSEGLRGLAGEEKTKTVTAKYFEEVVNGKTIVDNKKLVVTFPAYATGTRGSIVLKDIKVQAEEKKGDCKTGEVKVTVASKDNMADTKLVVANVTDYGVALTVDEVDKVVAGKDTTTVKVKVKENAIDTLNKKRAIYFTVEEGYFAQTVEEFNKTAQKGFTMEIDKDDVKQIVLDLEAAGFKDEKINEFEFEVEVGAHVTDEKAIVINAESRNFEEDMQVEVATIDPSVEVKSEAIVVKTGLKDQVGGKIVLSETDAERFGKNQTIVITNAETDHGFFVQDAKVEVTGGDIQIKSEVKNGAIIITVKRTSDEASEITISDLEVTTNRSIPEGTFDFKIGGSALSVLNKDKNYEDAITVEDFIVVSTKNTEDLPNAAAAKEIVLTVGSTAYTVNGEAKTADAAAFIDANNRTMVPVRFVAEEFGKIDFGTVNGVGTVTVFKDGAVLQFQNGSNIMNKNGIAIPMDTNVVIKDGRTYVPFKYVADGLGINYSFDAATKSITFTNQVK